MQELLPIKIFFVLLLACGLACCTDDTGKSKNTTAVAPGAQERLIAYGRNLVVQTARYLGPKGSVLQISNGMNCQNCHIRAGTQPGGNSFMAVASTYPQYRARSGRVATVADRINECLERSLNGKPLDTGSMEIKAMTAYINSVRHGILKKPDNKAALTYLSRAADPHQGRTVYQRHCKSCHGLDGAGVPAPDSSSFIYPPLWGAHSYNVSAGLFRLSRLAAFIKNNMPLGTTWQRPLLSNEEAWDVAAFIAAQPRPLFFFSQDWPKLSLKPVDYPFGPYSDSFPETQHKYGPFDVIQKWTDKAKADLQIQSSKPAPGK